jgi:hypothetical protein
MRFAIGVWLAGSLLIGVAGAQENAKPALRKGIHVEMAVAGHPVEMRAADGPDATVVAITADGKVFLGIHRTEPAALGALSTKTVYVKADSRVPFQDVLAVLDALRGRSVVLLTASPRNAQGSGFAAPYGMKLIVSR